jgi:hypothetical protein
LKYYAWAGWERVSRVGNEKILAFIIVPITLSQRKSEIQGAISVDIDYKKMIGNLNRKDFRGSSKGLSINEKSIFDNMSDAGREVVRGLFKK